MRDAEGAGVRVVTRRRAEQGRQCRESGRRRATSSSTGAPDRLLKRTECRAVVLSRACVRQAEAAQGRPDRSAPLLGVGLCAALGLGGCNRPPGQGLLPKPPRCNHTLGPPPSGNARFCVADSR
eukprot:2603710-Rhodomonas_salina.1